MIAWLHWNPSRNVFKIPFFDHPVAWYGICFVLGFVLGYFLMIYLFKHYLSRHPFHSPYNSTITVDQMSHFLADRLCWFVVLGTLIGARLGAVLFYDWDYYSANPLEILKTWKGGLASHGGAIGVWISLIAYFKYMKSWVPQLTFMQLLDMIAVPIPLAGVFIRIGNFINQEILGTYTTVPWAVIFENPADGTAIIPRHPVQLYEALCYLAIFVLLYLVWEKRGDKLRSGTLFGWSLMLIFLSRFILEFWKAPQYSSLGTFYLQMGQILSLPFILIGGFILFFRKKVENKSLHLL